MLRKTFDKFLEIYLAMILPRSSRSNTRVVEFDQWVVSTDGGLINLASSLLV